MTPFAHSPAALDRDRFVDRFGGIYEHSPWIAEQAYDAGLTAEADSAEGLAGLLRTQVEAADRDAQLALLRAHPDLAGKLALAGALTAASSREQTSAGLDACSPEELSRFQALNDRYKEIFGFPFILAVAGRHRTEILEAFERRVDNDPETEFREALDQVHRIARLRLQTLAQNETPR